MNRLHRFRLLLRLLAALLLGAALLAAQKADRASVVSVVDGDTFEVLMPGGGKEKIRLIGVDCPESGRNPKLYRDARDGGRPVEEILKAGMLATEFVRSVLKPGDTVDLEYDVQARDRYGRLLAYVFMPDGRMLNRLLLEEGYASLMTMPPNVRYVESFLAAARGGRGR
jgi:micrococcal nuclease